MSAFPVFRRHAAWLPLLLLLLMLPLSRLASAQGTVLINEVDSDTAGTDAAEFIELYDGGAGNTPLDGLVVVLFNGNGAVSYAAFDLDGYATDGAGYFVLGNAAVSPDIVFGNNTLQNGPDAVALYQASAGDFPNGTAVTTANLLDAIVYDTADPDDAGLLPLLNPGQPQVDEQGGGDSTADSSQRCPNGAGGARNTDAYAPHAPTAGGENICSVDPGFGSCGDPATFIHAVQGDGASSPLAGTAGVVVEGVVVGDFQPGSQLSGFFLQEEDADADLLPATSEGIFVYDAGFGVDVAPGDVVRVQGTVAEFNGLTELKDITNVAICGTTPAVTPVAVTLPLASLDAWETAEGMLVTFDQTLTATESYNLGRYGELVLAADGRLFQPTNVAAPGAAAGAVQIANDLRRILLDDASTAQNPPTVPYLAPDSTLRAGDTTSGLTGVLSYAFGSYRIQPTQPVTFTRVNARDATPQVDGRLKVASFNVLNYFNGDGLGGGFPTARGADTPQEFARQRAKIIAALVALDADVIGLMEIENDGFGPQSAIQDLLNGVNAATAPGVSYAFVDPGLPQVGSDQITVGLLYRVQTVAPVGTAVTTSDPPFDTRNRQPLVQSFEEIATGERLTVAVNHFKSKGSCPASGPDADQGDGQGCWNALRTQTATFLANWLATNPTGVADDDVLIIGDLNAYALEDPITALRNAGYADLVQQFVGTEAYSYVFEGQYGYLDHALANAALLPQVTAVTEWHINADEPRALDYNDYNQAYLYEPSPYRASDHDPVLIGLDLGGRSGTLYLPLILAPEPDEPDPDPGIPPDNLASEQAIIALLAEQRRNNGLPVHATQPELTQSARRHSNDMADNNFTDHTGSDGSKGGDRMRDAGYSWSWWGEIIGWGFGGDEAAMVNWWMNSPVHRDAILSTQMNDLGAGYAFNASSSFDHYWTVNFGKRAAPGEEIESGRLYTCVFTAVAPGNIGGASLIWHSPRPCGD